MATGGIDYDDLFKKDQWNWLKCRLAMHFTREALVELIENELKSILTSLNLPRGKVCSTCSSDDLSSRQTCPVDLCHKVADEIKRRHRYGSPSWSNTNPQSWYGADVWPIAKCFMPVDRHTAATPAKDIDFSGIINVVINCTRFDNIFPLVRQTPGGKRKPELLLKVLSVS